MKYRVGDKLVHNYNGNTIEIIKHEVINRFDVNYLCFDQNNRRFWCTEQVLDYDFTLTTKLKERLTEYYETICQHTFKDYHGFTDSFKYCAKCDTKDKL